MAKYNPHPQAQTGIARKFADATIALALSAYKPQALSFISVGATAPQRELIALSAVAAHS